MGETTSAVTALAGGQPCFKCGLMEFMLSQTQDNACQQSCVWDFFFLGGGGGLNTFPGAFWDWLVLSWSQAMFPMHYIASVLVKCYAFHLPSLW